MATCGILILISTILSAIDILTGVLKGVVTKKAASHTMAQGLAKKAMLALSEAVGFVLTWGQQYVDLGLGFEIPFCHVICGAIIIMETISIIENVNESTGGKLTWILKEVKKNEHENEGK